MQPSAGLVSVKNTTPPMCLTKEEYFWHATHLEEMWKTRHYFFQMENNSNFLKMEDNLDSY
jgi:hypothetical protein